MSKELNEKEGKNIVLRKNGSKRVYTVNKTPSLTDQSYKKEVNVNDIMRKFHKTGQVTHISQVRGSYGDVSEVPDLDVAMQQIKDAESAFMELPSGMRKKFHNSPAEMLKWLSDPKNDKEAQELGLRTRKDLPDASKNPKQEKKGDAAKKSQKPDEGTS